MIARICDRCGRKIGEFEGESKDFDLAIVIRGEEPITFVDLCDECMSSIRRMVRAWESEDDEMQGRHEAEPHDAPKNNEEKKSDESGGKDMTAAADDRPVPSRVRELNDDERALSFDDGQPDGRVVRRIVVR